ncbi:MAG: prolyl oligopeptidase family serine peptidase [Candidatus Aenigmarchaeota archaeon]|nr:prolyl oligopeptidase family serine peptidase [Candidatus Aenigmarchaeota archaeon]
MSKSYFTERMSINQEEIVSKIKCPVLIIHGDQDESVPLDQSKSAMKYLSNNSKLEIVEDGDHRLNEKINIIVPLSVNWFKKYI